MMRMAKIQTSSSTWTSGLETARRMKEIKATPIHRFWKVGEGWVMARDLKPGDHVRALGEVAVVKTVQSDRVEPVLGRRIGLLG